MRGERKDEGSLRVGSRGWLRVVREIGGVIIGRWIFRNAFCLKMMIRREFEKEREKFEGDGHFKRVLETFSGTEQGKDQKKRDTPRVNSWHMKPEPTNQN